MRKEEPNINPVETTGTRPVAKKIKEIPVKLASNEPPRKVTTSKEIPVKPASNKPPRKVTTSYATRSKGSVQVVPLVKPAKALRKTNKESPVEAIEVVTSGHNLRCAVTPESVGAAVGEDDAVVTLKTIPARASRKRKNADVDDVDATNINPVETTGTRPVAKKIKAVLVKLASNEPPRKLTTSKEIPVKLASNKPPRKVTTSKEIPVKLAFNKPPRKVTTSKEIPVKLASNKPPRKVTTSYATRSY